MNKKTFSLTLLLGTMIVSGVALFSPVANIAPAFAQSNPCTTGTDCVQSGLNVAGDAFPAGAKEDKNIPALVHKIINWALYIAAIAAVIMLIIGGYMYIFSAGDTARATKGRTTMVNALIGLTLIVLSYIIVQVVYNFLINRT